VISALMKLAGGSPSFSSELSVDAFLQQARSYDEASNSMLGWYIRNAQTRALSHPLPVMRAREVDRWSQSAQYKSLLSRARRPAATPPCAGNSNSGTGVGPGVPGMGPPGAVPSHLPNSLPNKYMY